MSDHPSGLARIAVRSVQVYKRPANARLLDERGQKFYEHITWLWDCLWECTAASDARLAASRRGRLVLKGHLQFLSNIGQ